MKTHNNFAITYGLSTIYSGFKKSETLSVATFDAIPYGEYHINLRFSKNSPVTQKDKRMKRLGSP